MIGLVGNTGVVYKVRPEKGGKESTQHRNALKVCITHLDHALEQGPAPRVEAEVGVKPPLFGTVQVPYAAVAAGTQPPFYGLVPVVGPAHDVPVIALEQGVTGPRRSIRVNLGLPPGRYRDVT